jgi:hypothetical protein
MRSIPRLALAAAALALSALTADAQVKQFRDWLAACDNARTCVAFGLRENATDQYLRVARGSEPDATVTVSIVLEGKYASVRLRFDDRAAVSLPDASVIGRYNGDLNKTVIDVPTDAALIDALRSTKELTVVADDNQRDPISLSGAVAALLWIDEQQKRLDTVTALIRRGNKPASAVPAPPALPVVRAGKPGTAPADRAFPKAVLAKGRTVCGTDDPKPEPGEVNALSGNLLGYWFECRAMSGAYNAWSALLIAPRDKPEAARVVQLPYPRGEVANEGIEKHLVVNAGFDEKTLKLTMLSKSRGPGDCGSAGEWVFDGKEFRLTRYQTMPVCAGLISDEWPMIFRAEVK